MRRAALTMVLAAVGTALARPAWSRDESFVARVDRTRIALGETFTCEVTLSIESGAVSGYRAPSFRGFRVIGEQPSQSTQIQMGGGASFMRSVYTWRYELEAVQQGPSVLGPARVRVAGRELETATVAVTVVDDGPGPGPRPAPAPLPRTPAAGFGFPSGEPSPERGLNFLRVVADRTRAYVGEQVTVEWFLYLSEPQDKYQTITEPRADGCWVEDLSSANQRGLQPTRQTYEGETYLVASLLKRALFALSPGRHTVTPMESEISRVGFFGDTVRTERLKVDPLVIEALPLPAAGQPIGFDHAAVGRFGITAKVDRDRVGVGEAVTLVVTLSGQGNLRKLPVPTLAALDGWKVYQPKVKVALEPGDVIGGNKNLEYLLLPERPGATVIAPLSLAFFDPAVKSYVTASSLPLRIEVTAEGNPPSPGAKPGAALPGALAAASAAAPGGVENVLGFDIRPPRARRFLRREVGTSLFRSRAFTGVVLAPPLAFGLTVLAGRVRERLSQDTGRARRRRLRRLVRRRLSAAETHLQEGGTASFYIEIDRVLRELLSGRLGRPVTGLARDELRLLLADAGLAEALVDRTLAALEECDLARFAPGSVAAEAMQAALDRAGEIILQIEKTPLHREVAGS